MRELLQPRAVLNLLNSLQTALLLSKVSIPKTDYLWLRYIRLYDNVEANVFTNEYTVKCSVPTLGLPMFSVNLNAVTGAILCLQLPTVSGSSKIILHVGGHIAGEVAELFRNKPVDVSL